MTKFALLCIGLLLALWTAWCISIVFEGLSWTVFGVVIIIIAIMALYTAELA